MKQLLIGQFLPLSLHSILVKNCFNSFFHLNHLNRVLNLREQYFRLAFEPNCLSIFVFAHLLRFRFLALFYLIGFHNCPELSQHLVSLLLFRLVDWDLRSNYFGDEILLFIGFDLNQVAVIIKVDTLFAEPNLLMILFSSPV